MKGVHKPESFGAVAALVQLLALRHRGAAQLKLPE